MPECYRVLHVMSLSTKLQRIRRAWLRDSVERLDVPSGKEIVQNHIGKSTALFRYKILCTSSSPPSHYYYYFTSKLCNFCVFILYEECFVRSMLAMCYMNISLIFILSNFIPCSSYRFKYYNM